MARATTAIDYALSIGPNCRAKHHLLRRYGSVAVGGVFDWQITPPDAICAYLERDFQGMMELSDLDLWEEEGCVLNTRYHTIHQHEFPKGLAGKSDIAASYAQARSRHEHVCATTRRTLRSGRRVLLAFSETIDTETLTKLERTFTDYAGPTELHFVSEPGKPNPALGWQGDPTVWNAMLQPYRANILQWAQANASSMVREHYRRPPRL